MHSSRIVPFFRQTRLTSREHGVHRSDPSEPTGTSTTFCPSQVASVTPPGPLHPLGSQILPA